jgi:hypothetical protein
LKKKQWAKKKTKPFFGLVFILPDGARGRT